MSAGRNCIDSRPAALLARAALPMRDNRRMHPLHIVYLNGPDIARLALTNQEILETVERSLAVHLGAVAAPPLRWEPQCSSQDRFDVLCSVDTPRELAGVGVAGDFPGNHEIGLPSSPAVLTLFDPDTGVPMAILNATGITAMSTGAMTAIGGKYLAPKGSKALCHIGARGAAYWNVRLLNHVFDFEEIRVHSKRPESRHALAVRLSQDLGKEVTGVEDWESCVRGADIVVEAARLAEPQPLLRTQWIKPGALVIPYGTMSALELSLTDAVQKVVVDDWSQFGKGMPGALRRHVDLDRITEQSLHAELREIVAGLRPGRERDSETILFSHRGSHLSDLALGSLILDRAGAMGVGQTLRFE
jgi:alanine dehydrogenase